MSGLSRTVLCSDNSPIAEILFIQRDLLLAKGDLQRAQTLEKAYMTVCDHASPITTVQGARKLKNVGPYVSSFLEPFFAERQSAPTVQPPSGQPSGKNGTAKRKYCPAKHSGAYALLITLLRGHQSGKPFMRKQELIDEAEKTGLSNKPIRPTALSWTGGRPNSREMYSGWSAMKGLVEKCLVVKSSNPAKYKLTEEGTKTAQECLDRSGFSQDNTPGQEIVREENLIVRPASQGSGEFGPGRQESLSSDDDIQEIRRSDLRDTNNLHFTSSQASMRVDGINHASSSQNPSGNASRQSAPLPPRTASLPRAASVDVSRNKRADYPVRARNVQRNSRVEIGAVDPDFKLAVPPLEAGEKFSDVYEIICILDNREKFRRSANTETLLNKFADNLRAQFKVKVETRCLPVGDAVWIARHKQHIEEYVLDFLVERKNVSDLWQSIKDGRYKQQKLRMMNCGLKVLLYLVEGDVNNIPDATVSAESLKTAMFTTELQGGFRLLRTDDSHDTCKQYGHLTLSIIRRYNMELGSRGRSGQVCKTYKDFVENCKDFQKNRVKDVYCCQLTQIGQVTEDIALSIQEKYPTLFSLAQAFSELEGNQVLQEKMLQGIPIRNTLKTISAVMSRNIYKAIWAP